MTIGDVADLRECYLSCLRRALIGVAPEYPYRLVPAPPEHSELFSKLRKRGLELVTRRPARWDLREAGGGWPVTGQTMIGERRLTQLQDAVETVIAEDVEGDLIETGVWRGGATIMMRAVLQAHGVADRRVCVADSFQGLPAPDPDRFAADAVDPERMTPAVDAELRANSALCVGLDEVRANFASYGLLDDQVEFLPGWFRDTLPAVAGRRWAIVRLDGDMYESTIQGLEHLYPSLSPGGYLIVDDLALPPCRKAVEDYRAANSISEPIEMIDHTGGFWRKPAARLP